MLVLDKFSQLDLISTIVSIIVIFLLVVTFGILFLLHYRYYKKCILHHLEDDVLKKEVLYENKKYLKKTETLLNDNAKSLEEKKTQIDPLASYVEQKKKKHIPLKIAGNIFLGVFYALFVLVLISAIYIKSSGDMFVVRDTSCLVIQSGSMEEKNEYNTYLFENQLDDQISTYSLISIRKVAKEDIHLYDIIAFKDQDNRIIVHRVIQIYEENGEIRYMAKGDANNGSASYELSLRYEDILGKYTGYQSFALGVVIYYFQSGIGMITLCFGLALVGFYDLLDIKLGKYINSRKQELYLVIDQEIQDAITNKTNLPYLNVDFSQFIESENEIEIDIESEIEDETQYPDFVRRTFVEKLLTADPSVQEKYNALKNVLLRYPIRARMAKDGENFYYKKQLMAKMKIIGKTLRLYVALDPKNYVDGPIPTKDVSDVKTYQKVPLMIKVKSNLSLKRAKLLIAHTFENIEVEGDKVKDIDWIKIMVNSQE